MLSMLAAAQREAGRLDTVEQVRKQLSIVGSDLLSAKTPGQRRSARLRALALRERLATLMKGK